MSNEAIITQKAPYAVNVEAGKTYYWCSCGRSKTQPFCDGAHQETTLQPIAYLAEKSETVYFCGCKHNSGGVMCDGSHNKL